MTATIALTLLLLSWIIAPVVGHTQSAVEIASIQNNVWEKIFIASCKTIITIADSSDNPMLVYSIKEWEDINEALDTAEEVASVPVITNSKLVSLSSGNDYSIDILNQLLSDADTPLNEIDMSSSEYFPLIQNNYGNTGSSLPVITNTSFASDPTGATPLIDLFEEPNIDPVKIPPNGASPGAKNPSETQIEDILKFFDSSVDNGTLCGKGRAKSARNRRRVVRKTIMNAGEQIKKGHTRSACKQLQKAYERSDGKHKRSDFIKGGATPELADMIKELIDNLAHQ